MFCAILKPLEENKNYFKDCDLVENGDNSGIVGYKDAACGNDNICITINQNYGQNYEVKVLNSQEWTSSLRIRIRCFVGANSVNDKVLADFRFESGAVAAVICGDETVSLKDSGIPVIVNELVASGV